MCKKSLVTPEIKLTTKIFKNEIFDTLNFLQSAIVVITDLKTDTDTKNVLNDTITMIKKQLILERKKAADLAIKCTQNK